MDKIINLFVPSGLSSTQTPVLAYAFLGDAVFSLVARKKLLSGGLEKVNNLHLQASKFCSANGQSQMLDCILPILNQPETEIVRRARNAKTHKPPKSASLETYKKATALECLIGWLFAEKQFERLTEILEFGFEKIGENV